MWYNEDNEEILECPACNKRMSKNFISSLNRNVDICMNCGGMFFDNAELKNVLGKEEVIQEIKNLLMHHEFKTVDETEERKCPKCSTKMVKNYTNLSNEVQIDECYNCGGKFLDNVELLKINLQDNEQDLKEVIQKVQDEWSSEIREYNEQQMKKKPSIFSSLIEKIHRFIITR